MYINTDNLRRGRGMPRAYGTAKKLADACAGYLDAISYTVNCTDDDGQVIYNNAGDAVMRTVWTSPPTQHGLCVHLGINSKTWTRYVNDAATYGDVSVVANAVNDIIIAYLSDQLCVRDRPSGVQFALSANYGWASAQRVDVTADVTATATVDVSAMSLADKLAMIRNASDGVTAICDDADG